MVQVARDIIFGAPLHGLPAGTHQKEGFRTELLTVRLFLELVGEHLQTMGDPNVGYAVCNGVKALEKRNGLTACEAATDVIAVLNMLINLCLAAEFFLVFFLESIHGVHRPRTVSSRPYSPFVCSAAQPLYLAVRRKRFHNQN